MELHKILCAICLMGLFFIVVNCQERVKDRKKGALIGKLKTLAHDVGGTVWALDDNTLYIENFSYDGKGPDAFFWMGNESQPSPRGFIVPYPIDTPNQKQKELPQFSGENLILHLPPGEKIVDLKWFSVWCRRFTVDFGHVLITSTLEPPKKRVLPEFQRLAHGLKSGNITILDAKTFYIPNLHYDGAGPDAYFWVGKGREPDTMGHKIPNEIGSNDVLRGYEGEDIEIQLPDNLTVYDIDYLAVWCVRYRHNFGHVLIPPASELWVPPALGQTLIKPPWWYTGAISETRSSTSSTDKKPQTKGFDNCRQLTDKLNVEWQARETEVQIKLTAEIKENQYIAFGVTREPTPQMIDSDVVVVYYDKEEGSFHAVDYTITGKAQCDGTYGVCPDERVHGRNDASVIGGERENGITSITYSRPYRGSDRSDIEIDRNAPITVIAAIGTLNSQNEANYHHEYVTKDASNVQTIIFGSTGENDCQSLSGGEPKVKYQRWQQNIIRDTDNFTFSIGPTGGERGYEAITGNPPWGIAWWVNEMLIPEIYVERGHTYHFIVEGGNDPTNPARYHPLYITDSSEGSYGQKTAQEKAQEKIYAGVLYTKIGGNSEPTATGRYCEFKHKGVDSWRESKTFEQYRSTLHKECEQGQPGILKWTVQPDTPDLVYYQCYTHRFLGWKIHVNDPGFNLRQSGASSIVFNIWLVFFSVYLALR